MSKKHILNVNNRGYLFVGKLDGCPVMKDVKSFDISEKTDTKEYTYTMHQDESGKEKAGNMIRNGYLQLADQYGKDKCEILAISFRSENKIHLGIATREDIEENNKLEIEAKAKKASAKKSEPKSDHASGMEKLLKEGIIKPMEGKPDRFVYTNPPADLKEGDTIFALRTSGTYCVKEVKKDAKGHVIVHANDRDQKFHCFNIEEVKKQ